MDSGGTTADCAKIDKTKRWPVTKILGETAKD